jgi:uncharacterized protein YdgA (DUF945 family)
MKKTVIAVVVLVLLLGVAPWGIGRIAEKRVNAGLDRLVEQAPYLTIVDRKWTPGWFRSEQEVTFEVSGPWIRAMNPATVLADIRKAEESVAAQSIEATDGSEDGDAAATAQQSTDEGDAPASDAPGDAAAAETKSIRFTVRNEILHGPVLWPASLGFARVNTKLVLSDKVKKELIEVFGTDEPLKISSRVGFFGGGSTRFYGDGHTIKFEEEDGELKYDDFELDIGYSKKFDDFEVDGSLPRVEMTNATTGGRVVMTDFSVVGESERVQGELFDSDYRFAVDKLQIFDTEKKETSVENIHYVIKSDVDKGFMDISAKMGCGKIMSPFLKDLDFQLDEFHYDFSLRRLHAETVDKLMADIKAVYSKPVETAADVEKALFEPFKQHALELLRHDPEFVIDRIGIKTPEGEGYIKGVIRLKGVTDADLQRASSSAPLALASKVDADVTIDVANKLIEKIPNGNTGAGFAIDQGYARREGEKLVSRIEYKNEELKINGKPLPIPGFGSEGPPGGMSEGMSEDMSGDMESEAVPGEE